MPTMIENILDGIQYIGVKNILPTALYRYRKAWLEAKWEDSEQPRQGADLWRAFCRRLASPGPAWPATWQTPGRVREITTTEHGATFTAEHAAIEATYFAADVLRVRYLPHERTAPPPVDYAIAKPLSAWHTPAVVPVETEDALYLRTPAMTFGLARETAHAFIADAIGNLLRADVDVGWRAEGALRHATALTEEEAIFGLGERTTPFQRRGRTHILWNTDPAGYANDNDPIYLNIPTYVGLNDAGSYLVFYENPHYAAFDLGESERNLAQHHFAGGELRYYIIVGPAPRLLERYTELTGRHPLPPLWALGYHQSRWSYTPAERVRKLARDFRAHDVPCDAIHLDINYMDDFRNFTWDHERFPDLPALTAELRAQGIKLVSIIDPGLQKNREYPVYRSGLAGEHFCTLPDGEVLHAPVWPGLCAFPDFTAPRTRAWWGAQYRPLLDAGILGFWNDMNEPAIFSAEGPTTLPDPVQHAMEGRGSDHREAHNLYGMLMARASYEGLEKLRPEQRNVVITRSGWAGVQRHAISWTGDNQSTWESLRLTIPMMLGLGLSGVGFSGPDLGGFAGEVDGELFTRWVQMAAFMPLFRAHTILGSADQEPWSYGEPYLSINRRFIQLRYELLPYLYTAIWQMCTRGWPMVRPLWWETQENAALWGIDDAFLCGDALLVAPITAPGANAREIRLPEGAWYDYWLNRVHLSDEPFEQFAPLETLPLFVREGAVLPLSEIGPSVEQRKDKFLRLNIYPLTEIGRRVTPLYEDSGAGKAYQRGDYRVSRFVMERRPAPPDAESHADHLEIRWEKESAYQPPYEHIELTLHGLQRMPRAITVDGKDYPVLISDPIRRTALTAVPPFEILHIVL